MIRWNSSNGLVSRRFSYCCTVSEKSRNQTTAIFIPLPLYHLNSIVVTCHHQTVSSFVQEKNFIYMNEVNASGWVRFLKLPVTTFAKF